MSKAQCPMNDKIPTLEGIQQSVRRGCHSLTLMFLALVVHWTLGFGDWAFLNAAESHAEVIVVVGASGSDEYAPQFRQWADRWSEAAKLGQAKFHVVGFADSVKTSDRDLLKQQLLTASGPGEVTRASNPLWLILIGHGTFDGKVARFNLRGPDVASAELADWINPIERPMAIINCTSSSGPFLNDLSGPNRVVITATKSGHELNFARFGDYLSSAIADPRADLDKDEQTSLLEAYLLASSRVEEFYKRDGRLQTEHALLDDNDDKLGTPADWFQGVRATKSAKSGSPVDGQYATRWHLVRSPREEQLTAEARSRRDELERELAALRLRKGAIPETEYLSLIEPLLVEIARLYEVVGNETGNSQDRRGEK